MSGDKILTEAANQLGIKELAPEIYRDLLQPSVREVGEGLVKVAKAVCIATAPFEFTVWGYEKIREHLAVSLTKKLSKVPPENIVAPKLILAGPLLSSFPFVVEEEGLRELYASLLASAMNEASMIEAHPSFVYVIQQLSSEEAILLKSLYERGETNRICDCISNAETGECEDPHIEEQFAKHCEIAGLRHSEMFDAYLENLTRLRIVFKELRSDAEYVQPQSGVDDYASVSTYYRDTVDFSEYGKVFLNVCVGQP